MNLAQALSAEPMTLRQEPSLSFGRIADAWAQETAGQVGALTRDEIVARLSAALRSGEFDEALDAGELYLQIRPDPIDGGDLDCDFCLLTCDGEPTAEEQIELSPMPRRHRADAITINILARLFGDRADAASRNRAWLDLFEQSEITRGAFSSWVSRTGLSAPAFWFAVAAGKRRGRRPHEAESLVRGALEIIAQERGKSSLSWLENISIECLRRLVREKLQARQLRPGAKVIVPPERTKMREIIAEWRSAKLSSLSPRA